jgi:hypothetical protein
MMGNFMRSRLQGGAREPLGVTHPYSCHYVNFQAVFRVTPTAQVEFDVRERIYMLHYERS